MKITLLLSCFILCSLGTSQSLNTQTLDSTVIKNATISDDFLIKLSAPNTHPQMLLDSMKQSQNGLYCKPYYLWSRSLLEIATKHWTSFYETKDSVYLDSILGLTSLGIHYGWAWDRWRCIQLRMMVYYLQQEYKSALQDIQNFQIKGYYPTYLYPYYNGIFLGLLLKSTDPQFSKILIESASERVWEVLTAHKLHPAPILNKNNRKHSYWTPIFTEMLCDFFNALRLSLSEEDLKDYLETFEKTHRISKKDFQIIQKSLQYPPFNFLTPWSL